MRDEEKRMRDAARRETRDELLKDRILRERKIKAEKEYVTFPDFILNYWKVIIPFVDPSTLRLRDCPL